MTTNCHSPMRSATAASWGHAAAHARLPTDGAAAIGSSSRSSPLSSSSSLLRARASVIGVAAYLRAEPVGDDLGQPGDLRIAMLPGTGNADVECLGDRAWAAG